MIFITIFLYFILCWSIWFLVHRPVQTAIKMVGPNSTLKNCTIYAESVEMGINIAGNNCALINCSVHGIETGVRAKL